MIPQTEDFVQKKEKEKWQTIGRHAKHTNTLCKYQEI